MAEKNIDEAQTIRELTRVIDRKEIEIQDVKTSLAGVLQEIRNLNESNLDREVIKKKISEMATNTIYELLIDEKWVSLRLPIRKLTQLNYINMNSVFNYTGLERKSQMGKAIGIVRKLDELGRIVIPVEIRKNLNINIREPLEVLQVGNKIEISKRKDIRVCYNCGKH